MTKLQKVGLIMAIVSAVLWIIWLFVWLYSDFDNIGWVSVWVDPIITNDVWNGFNLNHFIYYALIVAFAVGVGLILEECSRKSLKKSLIVLFVSCLLWWLFWGLSIRYFATLCAWCTDHIAYGFWILFLMFLVLWFISCFFVIKYLTNDKKKPIIITLVVLCLVCVRFVWFWVTSDYYLLKESLRVIFSLLLIISIILCIVAWIKRYKEAKKSS